MLKKRQSTRTAYIKKLYYKQIENNINLDEKQLFKFYKFTKTRISSKIKISVEQKLKSLWMERVVDKSAFSVVHCNQIGQVKGTFLMNNI